AIAVPIFPAPTTPRRRSPASLLDMGCPGVRGRGALVHRRWLNVRVREQFPDSWNHLTPVQLDGRHLLFVRYSPCGVRQVESTEPEQPDNPGDLGRDRFHRTEIKRSFVDLGLESLLCRPRPSALGRRVLEDMSPVRPLSIE